MNRYLHMKQYNYLTKGLGLALASIPSTVCFIGAIYLMSIGVASGDWLLLTGLLVMVLSRKDKQTTFTCPNCNHTFNSDDD